MPYYIPILTGNAIKTTTNDASLTATATTRAAAQSNMAEKFDFFCLILIYE